MALLQHKPGEGVFRDIYRGDSAFRCTADCLLNPLRVPIAFEYGGMLHPHEVMTILRNNNARGEYGTAVDIADMPQYSNTREVYCAVCDNLLGMHTLSEYAEVFDARNMLRAARCLCYLGVPILADDMHIANYQCSALGFTALIGDDNLCDTALCTYGILLRDGYFADCSALSSFSAFACDTLPTAVTLDAVLAQNNMPESTRRLQQVREWLSESGINKYI